MDSSNNNLAIPMLCSIWLKLDGTSQPPSEWRLEAEQMSLKKSMYDLASKSAS